MVPLDTGAATLKFQARIRDPKRLHEADVDRARDGAQQQI